MHPDDDLGRRAEALAALGAGPLEAALPYHSRRFERVGMARSDGLEHWVSVMALGHGGEVGTCAGAGPAGHKDRPDGDTQNSWLNA